MGSSEVHDSDSRWVLPSGVPRRVMGIEIPSHNDREGEGLKESEIQAGGGRRPIEVDQSEASTLDPDTRGEHLQGKGRREVGLMRLSSEGPENQREQTTPKAIPILAEDLIAEGADAVDVDGGV